jgi:hypothetical protein
MVGLFHNSAFHDRLLKALKYKNTLFGIVNENRQCGNTTWILKSAIENPECIILCYNMRNAKELENKYFHMLEERSIDRKGRKHPKFLSKNSDLKGYKLPVIFDNSALF